jgi:hypothetical protein
MATRHVTGICLAVALSWSIGAAAQGTTATQDAGQQHGQAVQTDRAGGEEGRTADRQDEGRRESPARQADQARTVTVVGCVESARDAFAQRGIFEDTVVLTNASPADGDMAAFERHFQAEGDHQAADHREAATAGVGPYDADRDQLRDEVIVQHDGTRDDAARDQQHGGQAGAVGTTGAQGADRDRPDADRTAADQTAAAEGVTRDQDRHETTGTAGVAAERPTGTYDADRDGEQRAAASPGTAAHHEDRYTADPEQRTTGTSGETATAETADRGQFQDAQGRTFTLSGDKERELRGLVGRKVEVTGTVEYTEEALTAAAEGDQPEQAQTEIRTDTPGDDQARATNTGFGREPGRVHVVSPEERDAAKGRDRMERKPSIEVTSFRDIGSCETR